MHSLTKLFFTFLFLAFGMAISVAQTPADWWYFGQYAGLHFDGTTPEVNLDGQISALEGCATISDYDGNLLFYTDGSLVFDSTHTQMPNGFGLLGWSSSSQSAVVSPKPGDPNIYYIFTVDATENLGFEGLRYTVVDMTLNGGLGDVVTDSLNIQLFDSTTEKIAVYPHSNNTDMWIVGHRTHDGDYRAFKLTSNGVQATPVLSTIGHNYINYFGGSIVRGYAKFNGGGTMLASAVMSAHTVELMDFDRSTGQLTNLRNLSLDLKNPYGLEFSPSGQYLYVSCWSGTDLFQFDVSLGTEAAIQASMDTIPRSVGGTGGALQLGLDEKIYFAMVGQGYLGRINEPNNPVATIDFVDTAFYLGGVNSLYGLPTFVQSFLIPNFSANDGCFGDSTYFEIDSALVTGINWNFGDPGSGQNSSTLLNPAHLFSDTGAFTVTAIVQVDTIIDTVIQEIYIYPRQTANLGEDTLICINDTILLSARQPFASFLWSDSSNADTLLVNPDTLVWVEVYGVCDTVRDSIRIQYDYPIQINLLADTLLCGVDTYQIAANIAQNAVIQWSTGDSTDTIKTYASGMYEVNAVNACGSVKDTVDLEFVPIPALTLLPPDTVNCFDNEIVLVRPDFDSTTYVWSDSSSKKTYRVDTTETVWLAAFNECGTTIDTIHIIFNGEIQSELGDDTTICDSDTLILNAYSPGATYEWSTGDSIDSIFTERTSQLYVVTVTQGLCKTIESKRVDLSNVVCPGIDCSLIVGNVITPNGDGINDIWRVSSDCEITSFGLNIYNRWGQLVHFSDNAAVGWDGTIYGQPAAEGTYFYELIFKDRVVVAVDSENFQGSITLIR